MTNRAGNGRGDRIRTRDLRFWRPSLYQLSYTPAGLKMILVSPIRDQSGPAVSLALDYIDKAE